MDAFLQIKNLKVSYKTIKETHTVLDIDEIVIPKGSSFGLIGESGIGKTVLALTILGLLPTPPGIIEHGEILLEGRNLLDLSARTMRNEIRGKKISMIFQDPMSTLNPVLTVGQQLDEVVMHSEGVKKKAARVKSLEMLDMVKLPDPTDLICKYPHELSGGQRQRVIIALSLACGAECIIADEPTRNLDVTIQAGILRLLKELQRNLNVTLLFIGNNPGMISAICEQAAILYKGSVIETGSTHEVLRETAHPYTRMMLDAIPRSRTERIDVNKFIVPAREDSCDGKCRYYSMCTMSKSAGCETVQQNVLVSNTHMVKCCMAGGAQL